jgi:catechol 2,3-dioxygenase-like lactoylglutathione lyase family enzyme
MLGHLSLGVTDLERAMRFYDAVLAEIGCVRVYTGPVSVGYAPPGDGERLALKMQAAPPAPGPGFHLAFDAPDRAAVDRFYVAALLHGGIDEGAPGLRPDYGPAYYAAFVLDPDGNKLEAVHQ